MTTSSRSVRSYLSPREIEVLDLLLEGLSNPAIGLRMGITDHTVKVHIRKILDKANKINRTQLAVWWLNEDRTGRRYHPAR